MEYERSWRSQVGTPYFGFRFRGRRYTAWTERGRRISFSASVMASDSCVISAGGAFSCGSGWIAWDCGAV